MKLAIILLATIGLHTVSFAKAEPSIKESNIMTQAISNYVISESSDFIRVLSINKQGNCNSIKNPAIKYTADLVTKNFQGIETEKFSIYLVAELKPVKDRDANVKDVVIQFASKVNCDK